MGFNIPGETARQAAMRQRVERSNREREEQEKQRREAVMAAVARMEEQRAFEKRKNDMLFNMYLTASEILFRLEDMRNANAPKTPCEEWNDDFVTAVSSIPAAKRLVDETFIACMNGKK